MGFRRSNRPTSSESSGNRIAVGLTNSSIYSITVKSIAMFLSNRYAGPVRSMFRHRCMTPMSDVLARSLHGRIRHVQNTFVLRINRISYLFFFLWFAMFSGGRGVSSSTESPCTVRPRVFRWIFSWDYHSIRHCTGIEFSTVDRDE